MLEKSDRNKTEIQISEFEREMPNKLPKYCGFIDLLNLKRRRIDGALDLRSSSGNKGTNFLATDYKYSLRGRK